MLFNSQIFLILFLPSVYTFYRYVKLSKEQSILFLIFASLVFYGYWDISLLPLLLLSILCNWIIANIYFKNHSIPILYTGVFLNLAIIGIFKYFDFFWSNINFLISNNSYNSLGLVLPLGISFFTFQQISYLLDLKRGAAKAYPLSHYFLYISFFPQLIAGPIVRHNQFMQQLDRVITASKSELNYKACIGISLIIIGLVKKVVLGDGMAVASDRLFDVSTSVALSFSEAWLAAISFALQIYFDFSGYSDIAIGLALMFGFLLPINFNSPYKAVSLIDFWRRWHITLSLFIRDYLYISLGGNRHGYKKQYMALLTTMLIGGLWHGAAWTFILWGGANGLGLAINHVWKQIGIKLPVLISRTLTFIFIVATFVIFRSEDFGHATSILMSMFYLPDFEQLYQVTHLEPQGWRPPLFSPEIEAIILTTVGLSIVWLFPNSQNLIEKIPSKSMALPIILAISYVSIILISGKGAQEFIYFQF